jgi:hypothetical protein
VVISAMQSRVVITTQPTIITKTATLTVQPPEVQMLGLVGDLIRGPVDGLLGRAGSTLTRTGGTPTHGIVSLTGPAPRFGIALTVSSSDPTHATAPATVRVPPGRSSESFAIATVPVAQPTTVTLSAHHTAADEKTATLTIVPPVLQDLTITPASVRGGLSASGRATLTGPAPIRDNVTLSSNDRNGTVLVMPAFASVVPGLSAATFSIGTHPVAAATSFTISGSYGGVTKTADLIVQPPTIQGISLNPSTVIGGASSNGTVSLTGPPYPNMTVQLSSSNATVASISPGVLTAGSFPNGGSSASFAVQTTAVNTSTSVKVSASSGGQTANATLNVNPAAKPDLAIYNVLFVNSSGVTINSPQAGQDFFVCVNVVNSGNEVAGGSTLRLVLNSSGGQRNYPKTFEVPVAGINAHTGANACVPSTAGSFINLAAGYTYDFNIYVDVNNDVAESNEGNNYGHIQIGL